MQNELQIKDSGRIIQQYQGRLSVATHEIIFLSAIVEELRTELEELKSKAPLKE